jgi:hypothetical protein
MTLSILMASSVWTFKVVEKRGELLILESNANCSPGTVVSFGSVEFNAFAVIRTRISADLYEGSFLPELSDPNSLRHLGPGSRGETRTLLHSFVQDSTESPANFWLGLKNHYVYGSAEWLTLENGKDLLVGKMPHNMPFLLSLRQPTSEGYICLLSPEADGRVVVFYPNTRPGSSRDVVIARGTSENNLTYDARTIGVPVKTALLNVGLRAEDPGPTHFVVLLSRKRRPLSDFLPAEHTAHYVDWQGQAIEPWEIGPGFFNRGGAKPSSSGLDYIPGDGWGISHLTVDVAH